MRYEKPSLSYEQQAERLLQRGLIADKDELMMRLRHVGYYRLSAYAHPYRKRNADGRVFDEFVPGTTLEKIWLHYRFDRDLRRHFLDAIERIEVALRTQLAQHHTQHHSPFDYADANYFPAWKDYLKKWSRARIRDEKGQIRKTGVEFLDHFAEKYGSQHDYLPLWMAVEVTEFGFLYHFFTYSDKLIRMRIAAEWGIPTKTLTSWLHAFNFLRNDCAHHARVWNRKFYQHAHLPTFSEEKLWYYTYSPELHKWIKPEGTPTPRQAFVEEDSAACFLFIGRRWLRSVAPTSRWHERVEAFLKGAAEQGVDLGKMGLPPHWEEHPLWK